MKKDIVCEYRRFYNLYPVFLCSKQFDSEEDYKIKEYALQCICPYQRKCNCTQENNGQVGTDEVKTCVWRTLK